MDATRWQRLRTWLGVGAGRGAPRLDLVPIYALLRHHLTDDEIVHVAAALAAEWGCHKQPITDSDVRRAVIEVVGVLADDLDVTRVRATLERSDYPLAPSHLSRRESHTTR